MHRPTYKQRLVFFSCAAAMGFLSYYLTTFAILVIDYGLWRVVTEPIYPVATKPTTVLSNGVVWSETKSLMSFVITCALWISLVLMTQRRLCKRIGIPEDYLNRK
jgi:hypothetical protein